MRNKVCALLLALAVGMGLAAQFVRADVLPSDRIKIETVTTTTASAAQLSTTITSDHRIYGFSYSDSSAGVCGLYDSSAVIGGTGITALKGEINVASGAAETFMFPFPLNLANGLVTIISNTTGACSIYYR